MVASHVFDLARESILPVFSASQQTARYQASSSAPSIFLLMQGMLLTKIQLDDFHPTLARFFERLQLEPGSVSESEWIMMAVLNIGAVLEYGRPEGIIRKAGGFVGATATTSKTKSTDKPQSKSSRGDQMEGVVTNGPSQTMDDDRQMAEPEPFDLNEDRTNVAAAMEALSTNSTMSLNPDDLPYTLRLALQLMFDTLSYTLVNPYIPSKSPFKPPSLNPYITVTLTFLATLMRHETIMTLFERNIPWSELSSFLSEIAKRTPNVPDDTSKSAAPKLIGSSPLPEDWCLRGMEWVRRIYERGFWRPSKSHGGLQGEMDVLFPSVFPDDLADGIVEDGDGENEARNIDWNSKRWKRLRWCADGLVKSVNGLQWEGEGKGRRAFVGGVLQQKVEMWKLQRQQEEQAERQRLDRLRWNGADEEMDVDEVDDEDDDEEDPSDSQEVRELKVRLVLKLVSDFYLT